MMGYSTDSKLRGKLPHPYLIDMTKFIIANGEVHAIHHYSHDDLWRMEDGTVMAFANDEYYAHPEDNVCGVGIFKLNKDHWLNKACKPHDYMYSSPAFQYYHTRAEADYMLKQLVDVTVKNEIKKNLKALGNLMQMGCRYLGIFSSGWDNNKRKP